jgi:hypothetical protein
MSKKQYIGIIILAVMILGFVFYWHEYRPSQIKKECFIEAQSYEIHWELDFESSYKNCLRKRGL